MRRYSIPGAIVIRSSDTPDFGLAESFISYNVLTNIIADAQVQFYRYNDQPTPQLRSWQYSNDGPSPDPDLNPEYISVLLHEFGHVVADLNHPGDNNCPDDDQVTIMRPFGTYAVNADLKNVDRNNLVAQYGHRSQQGANGTYYKRNWLGSAWDGTLSSTTLSAVMYRSGNLTQNYAWTGFAPATNTTDTKWIYSSSAWYYNETRSNSIWNPSSAMAIDYLAGGAIWVYEKDDDADDHSYEIYYRLSTNYGQSFAATETYVNTSKRGSVSVSFDPYRRVYIIGRISDGGKLTFTTVPAAGSAQVGNMWSQWTGDSAWFGPSIACRNSANGCRIAYGDRNAASCFKWAEAEVSTTGIVTPGTVRSDCYLMHDMPSIVFNRIDDKYYRAFIQNNGASYTAWMASAGTSWTGAGDLYNSNVFHSAPQLATEYFCFFGCNGNLRGWLVRYR